MILSLLLYNERFLIIYPGLLFECNAQKLGLFLPPRLDLKMPFQAKTWLLAFVSSHIVTLHNGPCWKPSLEEVAEALTNVSFVLMNSSSKLCLPGFICGFFCSSPPVGFFPETSPKAFPKTSSSLSASWTRWQGMHTYTVCGLSRHHMASDDS